MSAARSILGVGPRARPDEVERAFRALAARAHPDRGGDPEQFRQAVAARDVLRPPRRPVSHSPVVVVRKRTLGQVVRDRIDRRHRPPRVI